MDLLTFSLFTKKDKIQLSYKKKKCFLKIYDTGEPRS